MERGFASANAFKSPDVRLAQKAAIPTATVAE